MFTGLIREIATVKGYTNNILRISSEHKAKLGDSIAINGICLTVIEVLSDGFALEVADETRRVVDESKFTGLVHMEPAMQMGDRFEGHVVQGHVDCIGTVKSITQGENATEFVITVPYKYLGYIIPKGSITIDGISLTVNDVFDDSFRLTIIPHTLENTLMKDYKVNSKLNIETDLFARYIEHILEHKQKAGKSLSWSDVDAMSLSY